jgi:hypothetical protein
MNERLVHFLGEMASLLTTLKQETPASRIQIDNIVAKRPSTMQAIDVLLNEARELTTLYNDLPGGESYPSEN